MFFCLSVHFSFHVFLSSVFHVVFCLIFPDLLRNMLHFQNVFLTSVFPLFCSSPFHLFSLFCLLLFSRFLHLFSLFQLPFFLIFLFSLCFFMSNSLWKKSFYTSAKLFFLLFTSKKTSFSLFPFSLVLFLHVFPCLVFFCVLKNDFSF